MTEPMSDQRQQIIETIDRVMNEETYPCPECGFLRYHLGEGRDIAVGAIGTCDPCAEWRGRTDAEDAADAVLALFSQPPTGCTKACSEMHTFEPPCEAAVAAADPEPERPQWVKLTQQIGGHKAGSVFCVGYKDGDPWPWAIVPGTGGSFRLQPGEWVPADPPVPPTPPLAERLRHEADTDAFAWSAKTIRSLLREAADAIETAAGSPTPEPPSDEQLGHVAFAAFYGHTQAGWSKRTDAGKRSWIAVAAAVRAVLEVQP